MLPLLTQLPIGEGRGLRGVVDLVQGHALLWPGGGDGREFSVVSLEELAGEMRAAACQKREELVEQVS